jgi:hypothetical protein
MLKFYKPPHGAHAHKRASANDVLSGEIKIKTGRALGLGMGVCCSYLALLLLLGVVGSPFAMSHEDMFTPTSEYDVLNGDERGLDLRDRAVMQMSFLQAGNKDMNTSQTGTGSPTSFTTNIDKMSTLQVTIKPLRLPHTRQFMSVYDQSIVCVALSPLNLLPFNEVVFGNNNSNNKVSKTNAKEDHVISGGQEHVMAVVVSKGLKTLSITHPNAPASPSDTTFNIPYEHIVAGKQV